MKTSKEYIYKINMWDKYKLVMGLIVQAIFIFYTIYKYNTLHIFLRKIFITNAKFDPIVLPIIEWGIFIYLGLMFLFSLVVTIFLCKQKPQTIILKKDLIAIPIGKTSHEHNFIHFSDIDNIKIKTNKKTNKKLLYITHFEKTSVIHESYLSNKNDFKELSNFLKKKESHATSEKI